MDNRIKTAFNRIAPDGAAEARMLERAKECAGRANKSKSINVKKIAARILLAAACLAIILSAVAVYQTNGGNPKGNLPSADSIVSNNNNGTSDITIIHTTEFGDFFQDGMICFVLARVTDTRQWMGDPIDFENNYKQASELQILNTVWSRDSGNTPENLSVTQTWLGDYGYYFAHWLRKDGLYLLPLSYYGGNWYVIGDIDVLYEVNSANRIWSNSKIKCFSQYNGMYVNDFSNKLRAMFADKDFQLTYSPIGSQMKSNTLAMITVTARSDKLADSNDARYIYYRYTYTVDEVLSPAGSDGFYPGEATYDEVYAGDTEGLSLIPGGRYLIFTVRYEDKGELCSTMIATISAGGVLTALQPVPGDFYYYDGNDSIFTSYNGQTLDDIRNIVARVDTWRAVNGG